MLKQKPRADFSKVMGHILKSKTFFVFFVLLKHCKKKTQIIEIVQFVVLHLTPEMN